MPVPVDAVPVAALVLIPIALVACPVASVPVPMALAAVPVALAVPLATVTVVRWTDSLARHCRGRGCRDQPEEDGQNEERTSRDAHDCLRFLRGEGPRMP